VQQNARNSREIFFNWNKRRKNEYLTTKMHQTYGLFIQKGMQGGEFTRLTMFNVHSLNTV